jgi:single-stranded-DNA-specific exonuclease
MHKNAYKPCSWHLSDLDIAAVDHLANDLAISTITARIMVARGLVDPEQARRYLEPSLAHIPDPFSLPGMAAAVEHIVQGLAAGKRIAIFGDYDVDGVTAAALLADFLDSVGHRPAVALPDRLERGYGIDAHAIERLARDGADIIITVDNGIRAVDAGAKAKELRISLVITDHHVPEGELPEAAAIVNPKLLKGDSALKSLSGCGVAFMLALALRKRLRAEGMLGDPEPNLKNQLDIVALGTIADIVPLTDVNRVLTSFGLKELSRAVRPGLRALLSISGSWPADISPGTVAFRLAPRINAAGRMGSAMKAFELLLTADENSAAALAAHLDRANKNRQKLEERALRDAVRSVERMETLPAGIVVHSQGWHVGVIGIVAAKLVEKYARPAVVISRDLEPARGSARSPDHIDLMEALAASTDLLVQYGGHAQAAGLAVETEAIEPFAQRFAATCKSLGATAMEKTIQLDASVKAADIDESLVAEISRCEPYGVGNPEPVLAMENVTIVDARTVGNGHLKLTLASDGLHFESIGFNMAHLIPAPGARVRIAFTPQFNTWNGRTTIQLKLKDIAPTETLDAGAGTREP